MSSPTVPIRKINALSKEDSRKICTAQVVVTLAGAARQLIDNCIDAGATTIDIRLKNYGFDSLEVDDNGGGIDAENFDTLCKPHATSKLTKFDDLRELSTLGFRGEALNALCALGNVTITTRTTKDVVGTKLVYNHSGEYTEKSNVARQTGTCVTVNNLFCSLPVRRKEFEKTSKREFSKVLSMVQCFALSKPEIKFICSNTLNGRRHQAICTSGAGSSLKDVVSNLFGGRSDRDRILDIKWEGTVDEEAGLFFNLNADQKEQFENINIAGFVSSCEHGCGRGSADRQFVYVNGRPVDYAKVCRVVNEVYQTYNRGQYPTLVLYVTVPPECIDVNVTPDKRTVFFEREKQLLAVVRSSILATFKPLLGTHSSVENLRRNETGGGLKSPNVSLNDSSNSCKGVPSFFDIVKTCTPTGQKRGRTSEDDTVSKRLCTVDGATSGATPSGSLIYPYPSVFSPIDKVDRMAAVSGGSKGTPTSGQGSQMRRLEDFAFKLIPHRYVAGETPGVEQTMGDVGKLLKDTLTRPRPTPSPSSKGRQSKSPRSTPSKDPLSIRKSLDKENSSPPTVGSLLKATMQSVTRTFIAQEKKTTDVGALTVTPHQLPAHLSVDLASTSSDSILNLTDDKEYFPSSQVDSQLEWVQTTDDEGKEMGELRGFTRTRQKIAFSMDSLTKRVKELRTKAEEKKEEDSQSFTAGLNPTKGVEAERELDRAIRKSDFLDMSVIGQFNSGFIITRLQSHLFIVDQHASDEKYNFEKLQKRAKVETQKLIEPKPLDIGAVQESILYDNRKIFESNGFEFRFPGEEGGSVCLTSTPVLNNWHFDMGDIEEILSEVSAHPGVMYRPQKLRRIFASRACRKSVMIGDALTTVDMQRIIQHLATLDHPWSCPHGRPTLRHLVHLRSESEKEKIDSEVAPVNAE